jgi:hypothetical protein
VAISIWWLFTLSRFVIIEVTQILGQPFPVKIGYVFISTINELSHILGDFFTNSSGPLGQYHHQQIVGSVPFG